MGVRLLLAVLVFSALTPLFADTATAQEESRIFDEAEVLSGAQEAEVLDAFGQTSADSGNPIYAFLVDDTNVAPADRADLLAEEAERAGAPENADVILVAPDDRWGLVDTSGDSDQAVYDAMEPSFADGEYAEGLIAGAAQIQDSLSVLPELLTAGGILGALAVLGGGAVLFSVRGLRRRRLEEERQVAEEEFAQLTTRMDEFDQKERLVAGYLEAQRPLLDQETEERIESSISDARTTGFATEFSEAAPLLESDPFTARERMARGRSLLEGAIAKLDAAEKTMNDYRAADETLEGRLRAASEEIRAAEVAEESARAAGVRVEPLDLRPAYDRLAQDAAEREARRDEYDPLRAVAEIDALTQKARDHRTALSEEVAARDALPEERHAAEGALGRARTTLGEYERSHAAAVKEFGPAALGDTPAPGELASGLRRAEGSLEHAARAASAGRFAEARSSLREATDLARAVMEAPRKLKAAVADADRKKREGEQKLKELEARLEQAKAREHLMDPYQRQRLREYEYQLGNARYGFFGGDLLTALILFEALDNDYMYMGDPSSYGGDPGGGYGGDDWGSGGDWGGGDFGGGDWGGGDWGGGDWGGGW